MKSIRFACFLLSVIVSNTSYSQTNWYWQNPLPQGNELNSICFINENIGFSAGNAGVIIKTTNGGSNWDVMDSKITSNIIGIHFKDLNTGMIATQSGIKLTTNGGINWINSSGFIFKGFDFTDENNGSFVTSTAVYKTTNCGINFVQTTLFNFSEELRASSILNGIGYTVNRAIYKTSNGGTNWSFAFSSGEYLNSVFVTDSNNAFIVGNNGKIFKTTNRGFNWISQPSGTTSHLHDIKFINLNTGYIAGLYGTILKTTNSGSFWFPLTSSTIFSLNELSFLDINKIIIIGEKIIRTTNEGNNWQSISTGLYKRINDISFINENIGIAVSDSGTALKTTNGGLTWINFNLNTSNNLSCVNFISSNIAMIYGNNSTVLKTTNGGGNWENQLLSIGNVNVKGASFIDDNVGALVGISTNWEYIYYTSNGGNNWTDQTFGEIMNQRLNDVCLINSNTGYVCGVKIFKTTNRGLNWYSQNILIENELISIDFINSSFGMAVGGDEAFLTTNGGNSWIPLTTNNITPLHKIQLIDSDIAYVIGSNGTFLITSNGGANWSNSFVNTYRDLNSLFFLNANTGFIVGQAGTILKTTNGGNLTFYNNSNLTIKNYYLHQNFPNPFNPNTRINYSIPDKNNVKIVLYDILGKEIFTMVNELKYPGEYFYDLNGKNLPSGVYFYKLEAGDFMDTKRMIILK